MHLSRPRAIARVCLVASIACLARASFAQTTTPTTSPDLKATQPPAPFLFCYFLGNGDGLHLAGSTDGLDWSPLAAGKVLMTPTVGSKLFRDPCITRGPDGTFHMVWTSGWYDKGIGHASSTDLLHWSPQQYVEVMKSEPDTLNCWAPESFYDAAKQQWLIFWASTIPGRFLDTDNSGDKGPKGVGLNHRIYFVTTKDFQTFSDTKILYNEGFSVIDATMVKNGDKFVLIFKDETLKPVKKNLRFATADFADGPFGKPSDPFSIPWVEGPTTLKIGDDWIIYYDQYRQHKYGAIRTKDFQKFDIISDNVHLPKGIRHGTSFPVEQSIVDALTALK